jgi:hypothetical protein
VNVDKNGLAISIMEAIDHVEKSKKI